MSKSTAAANDVLNQHLGKTTSITYPVTPYMRLYTTAPNDDGTGGVEVTGGGYSPQAVASKFPQASGKSISNNADINFGTATAGWGTVIAAAIWTAANGGTMLRKGTITLINITVGQPAVLPSGGWTSTEA